MQRMLLYDIPTELSASALAHDLQLLPAWRQRKVMSYRKLIDRVLSAQAFMLLREALGQVFGYHGDIAFDYLDHGKPVLKDHPEMHFNLSHCPRGAMCVVADHPVGCDIEQIPDFELDNTLLRQCFNDSEIASILNSDSPATAFARLWTKKEAVLKLTGEGISDDVPGILTRPGVPPFNVETTECRDKGYVYSIATFAAN